MMEIRNMLQSFGSRLQHLEERSQGSGRSGTELR